MLTCGYIVPDPVEQVRYVEKMAAAGLSGSVIGEDNQSHRKVIENDSMVRAEPVWDPEEHTASSRAVRAYPTKRGARDNKTLTLQESRAKEDVAGERAARAPRFVKNTNGTKPSAGPAGCPACLIRAHLAGRVVSGCEECMMLGESPDPASIWPSDRARRIADDVDPHYAGIGAAPSSMNCPSGRP